MRSLTSVGPARPTRESLPTMLLLAGALVLAAVVGVAIAAGFPEVAVALVVAIPALTLVLRDPWAAVLIWLAFMPFFVQTPDGTATPPVWVLHRLLVPSMVIVALVYRMLGLSRSHFRLSLTDLAIAVFVILGIANIVLLSPNPARFTVAFYDSFVVPICFYWLVRLVEPRDDALRRMVPVLVALVLFQSAIGLASWVDPHALPAAWLGRAGERTTGTLGGPGPYTVTLVFGSLIVLQRAMLLRSTWRRLALFAVVLAGALGVFLSLSRGSWLGALVAVAGVFFIYRRLTIQFLALSVVLGLVLAAGPLASQFSYAVQRIGVEDTAASRLITDNAAIRMIEARPLLGFGYGNFEHFSEQYKERVGDIPVKSGSAHHTYLALAAENGLPSTALYLFPAAWLLLLSFRRWARVPRTGMMNRAMLVFMWLAMADIFIVSNFMDMLHSSAWGTTLWWISLGLIHVILTRAWLPATGRPALLLQAQLQPVGGESGP